MNIEEKVKNANNTTKRINLIFNESIILKVDCFQMIDIYLENYTKLKIYSNIKYKDDSQIKYKAMLKTLNYYYENK